MKVLFAVNNENISNSIIKKYQQEYKEIISGKNVYYFNAIAKELQKDKSYDRIVISEDLEPFANNNYEVIDKFIFEKLDNISDEATSVNGQDIPIILICADRRVKSEALLVKIFGIGIYSALLGQDRSITNVCELIYKPRNKKDAKIYYHIDSEDVDYKTETEGDVSEIEIQNILNHYKKLGKNEEKYVESFDNIAAQYTDSQLRVICKFLPLNVKAVLEANSQKYQELITFGTVTPSGRKRAQEKKYNANNVDNKKQKVENKKIDILEKNIGKSNLTRPVIIPSTLSKEKRVKQEIEQPAQNDIDAAFENTSEPVLENDSIDINMEAVPEVEETLNTEEPKKRRGRPKKVLSAEEIKAQEEAPKRGRGRPKKAAAKQEDENILPGFEEIDNLSDGEETVLPGLEDTNESDDVFLPGFTDMPKQEVEDEDLFDLGEDKSETDQSGIILPGFDDVEDLNSNSNESKTNYESNESQNENEKQLEDTNQPTNTELESLQTGDKKLVAFVGTSKNGTSFLVNNLAIRLSQKGIRTAILDLTKNKNSYYIYTQNEEELRKKAYSCIKDLKNGIADGISVNKNLTVYTTLPGEDEELIDCNQILATLEKNYALVLLDCDFDTPDEYFRNAHEMYLVQSFDILTIQPLTAFLRNLKSKNLLNTEKIRVVLNKVLRVRTLSEKTIIGGMAFYNDPAMSFMTELFNKDTVKYCTIPFEEQTYSKYLEGLVNCEISLNGYSKNFMTSLENLADMVYPLLSNNKKYGKYTPPTSGFSKNMNDTLNKMKNNY